MKQNASGIRSAAGKAIAVCETKPNARLQGGHLIYAVDDLCESSGSEISLRKEIADLLEDEQRSIPTPVTIVRGGQRG